jgi:hypothetical protein
MKPFACLFFVLYFFSCSKQDGEIINCDCDMPVSPHYIAGYHLSTDTVKGMAYKGDTIPLVLGVELDGEKLKTQDSELFRELAERFGDRGFNVPEVFGGSTYNIMVDTLTSISITCDKDFDAAHPAGEPLDDIISIQYESARMSMDLFYNEGKVLGYYDKSEVEALTSFNAVPHPLLSAAFLFYFRAAPEIQETFSLTVTGFYREEVLFQKVFSHIDPENSGSLLFPKRF